VETQHKIVTAKQEEMTLPLRRNPETKHDLMQKLRYQYSFEQKHKFTNQHEITTQSRFLNYLNVFSRFFNRPLVLTLLKAQTFKDPISDTNLV